MSTAAADKLEQRRLHTPAQATLAVFRWLVAMVFAHGFSNGNFRGTYGYSVRCFGINAYARPDMGMDIDISAHRAPTQRQDMSRASTAALIDVRRTRAVVPFALDHLCATRDRWNPQGRDSCSTPSLGHVLGRTAETNHHGSPHKTRSLPDPTVGFCSWQSSLVDGRRLCSPRDMDIDRPEVCQTAAGLLCCVDFVW